MYKKFLPILACIALSATSCSIKEKRVECLAPVTVHIDGFSKSLEELPAVKSVQSASAYYGIKSITLAFYGGNNYEQFKTTQFRNEAGAGFGQFSCELPIGTYTLVAIAHGGSNAITLTNPASASFLPNDDRARETFAATQTVTVNSTTPLDLSVTLNRIISKLVINSTDGRSSGIPTMKTTFSAGGQSFNPTTGLTTANNGFSVITSPTSASGATIEIAAYVFLTGDEQVMDVTIEALDASNNSLFSKTISDVPFRKNRLTRLVGPVFNAEATEAAFQVENQWVEEVEVDF